MKRSLRILFIFITGCFLIYAVNVFQIYQDYKQAKNICGNIKAGDKQSSIMALVQQNEWAYKSSGPNAAKISIKSYDCFCMYTFDNNLVVKNYGAYCQD